MQSITLPNQADVLNHVVDSNLVTGVVTVTAKATELIAGSSRLANRSCMLIKNESTDLRIRVGASNVTYQNGFPIEPGAVLKLDFNPDVAVPIYAVSEGTKVEVSVMEY